MRLDFAPIWLILKLSEDLTRTAAQDRGPGLGDKTETAVLAQDLGQASEGQSNSESQKITLSLMRSEMY